MTDRQFGIFIQMLMCADPWPLKPFEQFEMVMWADFESRKRGFSDWIDALHNFKTTEIPAA